MQQTSEYNKKEGDSRTQRTTMGGEGGAISGEWSKRHKPGGIK